MFTVFNRIIESIFNGTTDDHAVLCTGPATCRRCAFLEKRIIELSSETYDDGPVPMALRSSALR